MQKRFSCFIALVFVGACAGEPATPPSLCRPAEMAASQLRIAGHDLTSNVTSVFVEESYHGPYPDLRLELDTEGAEWLGGKTSELIGQTMDLEIDGEVVTSPRVNETIYGGSLAITGSQSREALTQIALKIAPPCPLEAD